LKSKDRFSKGPPSAEAKGFNVVRNTRGGLAAKWRVSASGDTAVNESQEGENGGKVEKEAVLEKVEEKSDEESEYKEWNEKK